MKDHRNAVSLLKTQDYRVEEKTLAEHVKVHGAARRKEN